MTNRQHSAARVRNIVAVVSHLEVSRAEHPCGAEPAAASGGQ